jgi:hypothetical protein
MLAAITITTLHRPFSTLTLTTGELSTQSFTSPTPFIAPVKSGRVGHTARTLKAIEMETRLLAIPCAIERHNVVTMSISASLATAHISVCNSLLEDCALSIARDRVRLSIGYLNAIGSIWPLGKRMAKEVCAIARATLASTQANTSVDEGPTAEYDIVRDDLIWPVNPSAKIDIYHGLVMPIHCDFTTFNYNCPDPSSVTLT